MQKMMNDKADSVQDETISDCSELMIMNDEADSAQNKTVSDHSELMITIIMIFLLFIIIIIIFYTEFLMRNISNFITKIHILKTFVDLILILIIENTVKYMTIIIMIFKHKMNFIIEIVFEFSVQIIVFLLSVIVLMR